MKIRYESYKLKDDAYPELSPESRAEINETVPAICEENSLYGYRQGVRNTIIGMGITALAVGTGVAIVKLIDAKKNPDLFEKLQTTEE